MICQCEHIDHTCGMNNNCQNSVTVQVLTIQGWYSICSDCYGKRHMAFPNKDYRDTRMEP